MKNFFAIVKSVIFKNFFNFEGRASRPEFWWFFLFNFIVCVIFALLTPLAPTVLTVISGIYSLAVLFPGLGLFVRRMHDINKSGWNILFALIPLVGAIILIIFLVKPGNAAENKYGPVPEVPHA